MKEILYDRGRFMQALKLVAFLLQILSCLSTFSTMARILDQYRLPGMFFALPILLVFLLSLDHCLMLNDKNFNCIIRGATTGFISGFFGNVVNDDFHIVHTIENNFIISLCNLEFLHIPVIAGTIMCMFCLLFRRLPPVTITILSLALGACCMALFSLGTVFFSLNPETTTINKTWALLIFISVFLSGIIPSVNKAERAWLLCLIGFSISVTWQFQHLETSQWDWSLIRFPIPGFLTSIIILFTLDVIDFHEVGILTFRRRRRVKKYDEELHAYEEGYLVDDGYVDAISTTLTWHCICYIAERTVLTLIVERQHKNRFKTDTWFCCLAMLLIYLIFVNYKRVSCIEKVLLGISVIFLYFCVGVTNGMMSNGYFIDSVFGIMFVSIFQSSDHVINA